MGKKVNDLLKENYEEIFEEFNQILEKKGLKGTWVESVGIASDEPESIEFFHCPPGTRKVVYIDTQGKLSYKCVPY